MLVSLNWLKKYVAVPDDTQKLVDDMTMAGLNVERVTEQGIDDPYVVVGYVVSAERHPNADRLRKCRVEIGEDTVRDIVCGAPNVAAGQNVLVALPGAKLPNGLKIRKSKIRGEVSDGMICSEPELGIGDDAEGIIVLEGDVAVGTPIADVLGPGDTVIEVEVTPNRPDQLSHVGIAREIAAMYGETLNIPFATEFEPVTGGTEFEVEIEDPADCARYVGKLVRGVKVEPSPPWLSSALQSVGLQSKNNIVDVTNFVLMETGQPIHAFDYKTLKGQKIIVRRGPRGRKAARARRRDLRDRPRHPCDRRYAGSGRAGGGHRWGGHGRPRRHRRRIDRERELPPDARAARPNEARNLHRRVIPIRARC